MSSETGALALTSVTGAIELRALTAGLGTAAPREYAARYVRAGRIIAKGNRPGAFIIPAEAIQHAVNEGLFNARSCFIDHPSWFAGYSLRDLAAVTLADATYNPLDQSADGTLRVFGNVAGELICELVDEALAAAEDGDAVPNIGLSMVFWPRWKPSEDDTQPLVVDKILWIESIDFIFGPAADGRIKQALSQGAGGQGGLNMAQNPETLAAPDEQPTHNVGEGAGIVIAGTTVAPAPPILQDEVEAVAPEVEEAAEDWGAAIGAAAVPVILGASALPAAARERLAGQRHASPEALQAAIATEQAYLAAIVEPGVIDVGGRAPRDQRLGFGPTGLEQMQLAWDWVFGVDEAKLPPPDLRRTDRLYYLLTGDGNWTGVFDEDAVQLAAASPVTLPGLAVNAMNKVIVALYDRLPAYRWFEPIVTVQPTDGSLHDMAWLQFGGIANLPVVADGAAYTELAVADSKESDPFVKHGGYVGITDKMLRNSDIAKIQAVPRALVVAALQTRSAAIAGIFTQAAGLGPTLDQDATALFDATHGNLATTQYSWDAWKAARLECAKQAELGSGKRTMLWPKFWLGPADLYDDALIDFGYGAGAGGRPGEGAVTGFQDVNPYAMERPGDPRPIPIPVPEFTDTNDWAYVADPLVAPVIQMAYGDSPGGRRHPAPLLFTVTSKLAGLMFTNDVLPIKVRDYWAYGVSGFRGIGKRNVA